MDKQIPFRFDASMDIQALQATGDPELKLGKVRVFYKHSNRNGSYITDEFAEKLALSAYHKPIVGTYNVLKQDFEGHEIAEQAKAYGYVLPNSLTWETHLDDDGFSRDYATYEVLIWARYWEEASQILAKTQSMEIDPLTIRGDWAFMDGKDYEEYVYTDGVIAGLCVLGDEKTPCFQGAAFFSTDDESYVQFTNAIKNYYGGKATMNIKVAGLEHEHFDKIWNALNPNFSEEGAYSINLVPYEITEDNLVFALSCEGAGKVVKYSYSLDEEGNLSMEEIESIDYVADYEQQLATEKEATAAWTNKYNTLFEANEELRQQFEALQNDFAALQAQNTEAAAQLNTQMAEHNNLQSEYNALAATLAERDSAIVEYTAIISQYEDKEKDTILNKFSTCLPAESFQSISERKNSLSIDELNTALALEYTKFSMAKDQKQDFHIPQEPQESSLAKILKAYKK